MSKLEQINFIRKNCTKYNFKAYKIAEAIGMTAAGVQRVIDGTTKNPNQNTVNSIKKYIDEQLLIIKQTDKVEESSSTYNIGSEYEDKILQVEDEIKLRENIIKNSTDSEIIDHQNHMISLLKLQIIEIEKAKNNHLLEK